MESLLLLYHMAYKCSLCGKGVMIGHNIRHKHTGPWERKAQKTPRTFKPNLKYRTIDGRRVRVCTSCIQKLKKTTKKEKPQNTLS